MKPENPKETSVEVAFAVTRHDDGRWYGAMFINDKPFMHSQPHDTEAAARADCRVMMDEMRTRMPAMLAERGFDAEIRERVIS